MGFEYPAWLERNWLFRKLFLLRKIFLTRRKTSCYSQFGEDISIALFFPKGYRGFYVDVGCFHPVKYSNTYRLYLNGWRGVNVDIDEIKIEAFDMVRGDDVNVACAIGMTEGTVDYFHKGFYRVSSTIDAEFARGKEGYVKTSTRCRKLTSVLDETPFAGRKIDFLSVDTEGHDDAVLRSLDFERYEPFLVGFEVHCETLDEVMRMDRYRGLADKGYVVVGWCGLTVLMMNPRHRRFPRPSGAKV